MTSQVKRRWILSWVNRNSAGSTKRMVPILGADLSVDNRATLVFLCASPLLTRPSVTAADGDTLDTDRFLIRGVCTVTAGSSSLGRRTGIHADHLIEIESCSVLFTKLLERVKTSRCYMRRRLLGESVLCIVERDAS